VLIAPLPHVLDAFIGGRCPVWLPPADHPSRSAPLVRSHRCL